MELQARQLAGTPANQPRVSNITDTKTIPEQALDTTPPKYQQLPIVLIV